MAKEKADILTLALQDKGEIIGVYQSSVMPLEPFVSCDLS